MIKAKHRAFVEASRTLAEKGYAIEVPRLLVEMDGEVFPAENDAIMERVDWSLARHPARLTEEELSFHRSQDVIEIDLDGEKLVYSRTTEAQPVLSGLHTPSDSDLEASLVQWLERECRAPDIPQSDMLPWIAALVADLLTSRDLSIRTLIDWQHQIAARIRWKIQSIREAEKTRGHQMALFAEDAKPTWSEASVVRFDETVYQTVPTQPTGAFRLKKHLLGADRAPLIDGDLNGEEFQCACPPRVRRKCARH